MQDRNLSLVPRRSSRVPTAVPILVTSLDPAAHFSEVCETLVVNAHGCAMRSRTKLETGVRLRFRSREGRDTTAQVVSCQPIGSDSQGWMLGARLERPDNFWGLRNCPKDWAAAAGVPVFASAQALPSPNTQATSQASRAIVHSPEVTPDDGVRQRAEEYIKRMIAESVQPLQSEIAAIREKLLRKEANPSRFDVSLSSIPAELEQQLELRLRKDLEPKILEQGRQQSSQLLGETKAAIANKTKEAHEQFSRHLANQHQLLEQQAQEISTHISENMRERLRVGIGEFQQKLVDGGNQLKRLSQELLEFLQSSLSEEHNARRGELDQLHAMMTSESSRFEERTEDLDGRIRKLQDTVRALESGLDQRLNQMCARTVSATRGELENAATAVFMELTTRSAQALGSQVDDTNAKMRNIQKEIIASLAESLAAQRQQVLKEFEKSMQDLAQASVERWRLQLATGLSALAKSLDEQWRLESKSSGDGNGATRK